MPLKDLVREKIQSVFVRKKPRDFFDIYFLLRVNLTPISEKRNLKKILEVLMEEKLNFKKELKAFLPQNYHSIIKDFNKIFEREIEKFIS